MSFSGDGTLRKNVDAWQRWNPAIAHGLHRSVVIISTLFVYTVMWSGVIEPTKGWHERDMPLSLEALLWMKKR